MTILIKIPQWSKTIYATKISSISFCYLNRWDTTQFAVQLVINDIIMAPVKPKNTIYMIHEEYCKLLVSICRAPLIANNNRRLFWNVSKNISTYFVVQKIKKKHFKTNFYFFLQILPQQADKRCRYMHLNKYSIIT